MSPVIVPILDASTIQLGPFHVSEIVVESAMVSKKVTAEVSVVKATETTEGVAMITAARTKTVTKFLLTIFSPPLLPIKLTGELSVVRIYDFWNLDLEESSFLKTELRIRN